MSKPPVPDDVVAMLRKPNPSVMTTLRPDGQPVSTATWYLWQDDGRVLVNLDEGRKRLEYLRNDPRVTLTVLDNENWYTHVSLIGRVNEIDVDPGLEVIDRLAHHYFGSEYPNRERTRVSVLIEVQRWHGWGGLKDNSQAG